jgi:hypothetical protein
MSKKLVKFRVHKGVFLNAKGSIPKDAKTFLFLNVRNDGTKPININKVGSILPSGSLRSIKNSQRQLPVVLQPGKEWETWTPLVIRKDLDPFRNFVLKYDNHDLRSTKRYKVPSKGEVPAGK